MITCCYCGARDVMSMGKGQRRALACLSCGAPMRRIEVIPRGEPVPAPKPPPERGLSHRPPRYHEALHKRRTDKSRQKDDRKRPRKRKKGVLHKLWDEIDDIFDFDDWFD